MFAKVLYPTDFSDVSKKALNCLLEIKGGGVKEVVLLQVIGQSEAEDISKHHQHLFSVPHLEMPSKGVTEFIKSFYQAQEDDVRKQLAPLEASLKKAGFKVKTRIERGVPKLKILQIEQEEQVDAIILGSHGNSNPKEMLLGSVLEYVIRHSKKAVIVIKR